MVAVIAQDESPDLTLEEVQRLVNRWWRATRDRLAGWPKRTLLGRIGDEGPQGALLARVTGASVPWLAPEVELVDRLIARMPAELRDAVVADAGRWAPAQATARRLGINVMELARRRERGYAWLQGALAG